MNTGHAHAPSYLMIPSAVGGTRGAGAWENREQERNGRRERKERKREFKDGGMRE